MKVTKLKAPFGWVGGKSKLAKDIVSLFPQHTTYVEVFGGALSVLYAKERSKVEVVNDINSELNKRATYKDVAKALGIPYNRLRQQIHKNTIPFEEILIFCFKRKISINYLFFNQLPETLIKDTDQLITLRYNSVLGSLGHGLINYELEPVNIVLDKYLLDFIEGSYYDTEVITGYGDSMEPFIQDGSLIFIDKTKTNLINNKIYAFLIEDRLYIKQYKKDKNMFW